MGCKMTIDHKMNEKSDDLFTSFEMVEKDSMFNETKLASEVIEIQLKDDIIEEVLGANQETFVSKLSDLTLINKKFDHFKSINGKLVKQNYVKILELSCFRMMI